MENNKTCSAKPKGKLEHSFQFHFPIACIFWSHESEIRGRWRELCEGKQTFFVSCFLSCAFSIFQVKWELGNLGCLIGVLRYIKIPTISYQTSLWPSPLSPNHSRFMEFFIHNFTTIFFFISEFSHRFFF